MRTPNRYNQLIERLFFNNYQSGERAVSFIREDMETIASELGIRLPKNLGDVIYSFRYRNVLPESIRSLAGEGEEWLIHPAGRSQYRFVLAPIRTITPSAHHALTKIPDATPGIIMQYAFADEQGLLAKLRYNRLIDLFTNVVCYSLQNHLRTTVPGIGQVEVDEVYVGIDRRGGQYVFPVQAKGGKDRIGMVQIEQDYALCQHKFPGLICRPIAAQFLSSDTIALFAFEPGEEGLVVALEKHYRLVSPHDISDAELQMYRARNE